MMTSEAVWRLYWPPKTSSIAKKSIQKIKKSIFLMSAAVSVLNLVFHTLLFQWDPYLLNFFGIPERILPEIR